MPIFSKLMIASWIFFLSSFFVGYIICHFIITPILLKKHKGKGLFEAIIYEGLQAEFHLKDLIIQTTDKAVTQTLKLIKYSKFGIVISLIFFVAFAILHHATN